MCVCGCLTHFGEQLGHFLWISLVAGGKDSQQTFQAQLGDAGALLFLACVLHHAGDVGVTPHQHAAEKKVAERKVCFGLQGVSGLDLHLNVCEPTDSDLVMSQRKRNVLSGFCPSGPSVCPVSSSCWIFWTATLST